MTASLDKQPLLGNRVSVRKSARVVGGTDTERGKRKRDGERVTGLWGLSHQSADDKRQTAQQILRSTVVSPLPPSQASRRWL